MSYTIQDIENATQYANYRLKLRNIKTMYTKYPNVTSHMDYVIRKADPNTDYYFTPKFAHKAIVVTTDIPQKLCDKISCNNTKKDSTCTAEDETFYYRIGDKDDFEKACQPACYNLMDQPVYDQDSGLEKTHMPRLAYTQNYGCIIQPPALTWFEHPFYRSQERYEKRLNDLPLGFNLGQEDPYSYSGKRYEYNEMYCASYFDKWDAVKKTCKVEVWEMILNAVVGESIIKLTKAGIETLNTGGKSTYPSTGLKDPPPIEKEWLVTNWKTDIDPQFILPSLDFTFDSIMDTEFVSSREGKVKTRRMKRDLSNIDPVSKARPPLTPYERKKSFLNQLKKREKSLSASTRDKLEAHFSEAISSYETMPNSREIYFTPKEKAELDFFKKKSDQRLMSSNAQEVGLKSEPNLSFLKNKKQNTNKVKEPSKKRVKRNIMYEARDKEKEEEEEEEEEEIEEAVDIGNIMSGLLSSMTDEAFWRDIGIAISVDFCIDRIKSYATKAFDKLIPKLTQTILASSQKFFTKVLTKSIFATMANTVAKVIIKSASKVMLALARLTASAASVIGVVFAIISIFDIILTFWDPLGFNNKFDKSIMDEVMRESDKGLRMAMGTPVPIMTFDNLCSMMLSTDEIIENSVKTFADMYDYLESLEVNSEGTRLYKGKQITVGNVDINQETLDRAIVKGKLYTPQEFYMYECDHSDRMNYFKLSNKYTLIMVGLGLTFMIMEIYLMGLIMMVIAIGIIFTIYLNTSSINMGKYSKQILDVFSDDGADLGTSFNTSIFAATTIY